MKVGHEFELTLTDRSGPGEGDIVDTFGLYVPAGQVGEFRAALAGFFAEWNERYTRSLRTAYRTNGRPGLAGQ